MTVQDVASDIVACLVEELNLPTQAALSSDLKRAATAILASVIEAIREPTEAMIDAAANTKGQMTYADVWRVMIDQIPSPQESGT
jgi:hypothetical protein